MIIGMDDQNIEALKRAAINEEERAKIFKMTDFCRKSTSYSEIPDPYYEGPQGFELVLDLLEDAGCRTLLVLFGPLLSGYLKTLQSENLSDCFFIYIIMRFFLYILNFDQTSA